jgi:hypothetical protein
MAATAEYLPTDTTARMITTGRRVELEIAPVPRLPNRLVAVGHNRQDRTRLISESERPTSARLPNRSGSLAPRWHFFLLGQSPNPGTKRIIPARKPFSHLMCHTTGGAICDATSPTAIIVVALLSSAVITTCQNHLLQLANQASPRKVAGIILTPCRAVPCISS